MPPGSVQKKPPATAEQLEVLASHLDDIVQTIEGWDSTRELSLVKTRVEEAEMWLGRAMVEHDKRS